MNNNIRDEAIILAKIDWGEADRIVTLYCRNYGKVRAIAKGVRRPSSRKRGALEIFSHVRFTAIQGKGMVVLTEVELLNGYQKIRADLRRMSVAYYCVEILDKTSHGQEESLDLFDLLLSALGDISIKNKLLPLRIEYSRCLLETLGFASKLSPIIDIDQAVEEVIERTVTSARVGKKLMR